MCYEFMLCICTILWDYVMYLYPPPKKKWRNLSIVAPPNFIHLEKKSSGVSLGRLEETHLPKEFINRKLSCLKIKIS